MDSRQIKQAITVAKRAYDAFSDYQDRKARETYDSLLNAADSYDDVADTVAKKFAAGKEQAAHAYKDSAKKATSLTEQARKRAQEALAEAQAKKEELAKEGKALVKSTKKDIAKTKKQGLKEAKKYRKELERPKVTVGQRFARAGLLSVIFASVAGVIYLVLDGKKSPAGTQPPKVSDVTPQGSSTPTPNDIAAATAAVSGAADAEAQAEAQDEEPKLVYSTQTPTDHVASPEEGATERDEELLGSIDEQMAKHRLITEDEDKK